jgi:hypothetical protein
MDVILHLIRNPPPESAIAEQDWVIYMDRLELVRGHEPPEAIDHDQLVALIFTADRVVTW